jgi:hydrogenase maturation factor
MLGAVAEVESRGRREWYNALAQPDVKEGDYVLTHANLITAIVSSDEAQRMEEAVDEMERLIAEEDQKTCAPVPPENTRDKPAG